jgi:hypothetical protein
MACVLTGSIPVACEGDRDYVRVNTSGSTRTLMNKFAWFVVVLLGLTAVSSIVASISGAQAILLAVISSIVTGAAVFGAAKLQARENRNRRAIWLAREQDIELERQRRQQQLQRQQELQRKWSIKQGLDLDCAELLRRAEAAVKDILESDARAENLLDPPVEEKVLRDGVEHVLSAGARITDLRDKQRSIAARSLPKSEQVDLVASPGTVPGRAPNRRPEREQRTPGPMTGAVLEPQQQALAMVLSSMTTRVENLEHYASSVKKVDATYRDWIGSQEAARLNDPVRDVLAEMVRDKLAAEELNRLTERTSMAEHAFRQSIQEANLAAETLALPGQDSAGTQLPGTGRKTAPTI